MGTTSSEEIKKEKKHLLVILKPDVCERHIEDELNLITSLELGNIEETKQCILTKEQITNLYEHHKDESYFEKNILDVMSRDKVILHHITTFLPFDKLLKVKEEIRKIYGRDKSNNTIHISDSIENGYKELKLFDFTI